MPQSNACAWLRRHLSLLSGVKSSNSGPYPPGPRLTSSLKCLWVPGFPCAICVLCPRCSSAARCSPCQPTLIAPTRQRFLLQISTIYWTKMVSWDDLLCKPSSIFTALLTYITYWSWTCFLTPLVTNSTSSASFSDSLSAPFLSLPLISRILLRS